MTTEVRTFGEFLRHAAGSEAPLWTSDFNISEIARRALQRVMGTEHEDAHCIGYTETLFFRVFSCWFSAMWRAHSVDWINGVEGARDGYEAATRAASNAAVAVDKFGTNLSIARETAIRNWLVENKGVGLTSTAGKALLNTFAATFDDAIIQPLTGNMIVKVGDEEPRQLRSAGDTEERAHTFDAPADNAQVKVECRMIISADQSGDFLKLTLLTQKPRQAFPTSSSSFPSTSTLTLATGQSVRLTDTSRALGLSQLRIPQDLNTFLPTRKSLR